MKKNIMHRNPIGHWERVATTTLRWKVILILFISTFAFSKNAHAYDDLRNTLDYMFAKIDRNVVPTGYLIDYAIEYEDLDKYCGRKNTSTMQCDIVTYAKIVKTLSSSSLGKTSFHRFKNSLYNAPKNNKADSKCRLSIIFQDYAQLKANSLNTGAITYENGQVYLNRQDAFQIKKLCAACIIDNAKENNDITFTLPKELILSNASISDVQIDCGNGLQSLINNDVHIYLSEGHHIINVVITDLSGNKYYSSTTIEIQNNVLSRKNTRSFGSSINRSLEITGNSYNGVVTKADVSIIYASNNYSGRIKKPLIFVEGFDPRDLNPTLKGAMTCESIYTKWVDFIDRNQYDFIYVDWQESGEYIQANAYTLINVIETINRLRDSNSAPAVIIGHSMGGLVARYALKTMENNNKIHNVETYVSYDAPHMGANVPIGLLYGFHGLLKFLNDKDVIDYLVKKYTEVEKLIQIGKRFAYSTATQQMLVDYIDPTGSKNNSVHFQWQTELDNLGFPNGDPGKEFKKIAIANSDYSSMSIRDKYIYCDFSAGSNIAYRISPLLSIAVGVLFQDVIAGLLTILPGRDEINGHFECLSVKQIGQKVTDIHIGYKKTFLWLIPISKTMFSYTKNHQGNCLYDTYPSSLYSYSERPYQDSNDGGFPDFAPIIYDWSYDIDIQPQFAFVPTSSALAVDNGINPVSSIFFSNPNPSLSAFDGIKMEHNTNHICFSEACQSWIEGQIKTTISGPSTGFTGAKYTISNQMGQVAWTSSDASLATISNQGVLTVHGKGIVKIAASVNGVEYSKKIIVGMPTYVLSANHVPGGYMINTNIISSQFKNYSSWINQVITFCWGIKYAGRDIKWTNSHSPSIMLPLEREADNVTVYLKLIDNNGNESPMQFVNAVSSDLFFVNNNILSIDESKNIYKENGSLYSYKNGKIYLTRDTSLPSQYQKDIWTSTKGVVFSPFSTAYNVTVTRGEIPIKQVLPEEELNLVIQNATTGKEYVYTIALLNPEDKIIQFIPVTFKIK